MEYNKLVAGRAIGAQENFLKTYNAIVDFIQNLKGDVETASPEQVSNGTSTTFGIKVDRTDPTHPVLRLEGRISTAFNFSDATSEDADVPLVSQKLADDLQAAVATADRVLCIIDGQLRQMDIGVLNNSGGGGTTYNVWCDPD